MNATFWLQLLFVAVVVAWLATVVHLFLRLKPTLWQGAILLALLLLLPPIGIAAYWVVYGVSASSRSANA